MLEVSLEQFEDAHLRPYQTHESDNTRRESGSPKRRLRRARLVLKPYAQRKSDSEKECKLELVNTVILG